MTRFETCKLAIGYATVLRRCSVKYALRTSRRTGLVAAVEHDS